MLTKKVKKRIFFLIYFSLGLVLITFFIFKILEENLLYFKTPSEISESSYSLTQKKIRLGGIVKPNSIKIVKDEITFSITDNKNEIKVGFKGTVPNLFQEGKGVVAEGVLKDKNYLIAERILAKHDENYKPPKDGINKNDK